MTAQNFVNGVLREFWNDANRTYTTYNASGTQTAVRPYTAQENADADVRAAQDSAKVNKTTIEGKIAQDMATMQTTILDLTNAQLNTAFQANQAAFLKDIARAIRNLDRVALQKYDGTS